MTERSKQSRDGIPDPGTIVLHPYQDSDQALLVGAYGRSVCLPDPFDLCIVYATASGKSPTARTVMTRALLLGLASHAVALVPMVAVQRSFMSEARIGLGDGDVLDPVPVREILDGTDLFQYLTDERPGHALVGCHAMMAHPGNREELKRLVLLYGDPFRGMILVVDEGHHSKADGLADVVRTWKRGKGVTLYLTATPHRADGTDALPEDAFRVHRTEAEQMLNGEYAPERLQSYVVNVGGPSKDEKDESNLPVVGRAADAMVREWELLGCPKTMGQVRNSGDAVENLVTTAKIHQAFSRVVGPERVLLATEAASVGRTQYPPSKIPDAERDWAIAYLEKVGRQPDLSEALKAEAGRAYAESEYDVIIGIQQVIEGVDWPMCSCVMKFGVSRSLTLLQQLVGRALRFRRHIPGYPEEWANKSVFVMFTAGDLMSDEAHRRQIMLVAAFLASYDVSREWSIIPQVKAAMGSSRLPGNGAALPDKGALSAAMVVLHMVKERERNDLDEMTLRTTTAEMLDLADELGIRTTRAAVNQVVLEDMASASEDAKKAAETYVITRDPSLEGLMEAVFREFRKTARLRDETPYSAAIGRGMADVLGMDHNVMVKTAKDLDRGRPRLREAVAVSLVQRARAAAGSWPDLRSRPFKEYDNAFRTGTRGLRRLSGGTAQAHREWWWRSERPRMADERGIYGVKWSEVEDWTDLSRWPGAAGKTGGSRKACPDWRYFPHAFVALRTLGPAFVKAALRSDIVLASVVGRIIETSKKGMKEAAVRACLAQREWDDPARMIERVRTALSRTADEGAE